MSLSATDYLLWVTGVILLMLTCWALHRRRFVHEFPVFFGYAGYHILRSAVLFGIQLQTLRHRMAYNDYFYTYWIVEAVSIGLGFCVINEIYRRVFDSYDAIRQFGSVLFAGGAILLLLAAVFVASFAAPGADTPGMVRAVLLLEISVRVVQCGLLVFLFALSFFFGLPWQNRMFGIALGFGVYASIDLAAKALRSHIGVNAASAQSQVQSIAYSCGVLIWTFYLFAPEPAPEPADLMFQVNLQEWNQAILDVWKR
jgi:hypothetical protein